MATGAVHVVQRGVVVRNQPDDPRHLVRVHVEERCLRVERRTAPFRATIEPWKHDDPALGRRREHAGSELPEPFEHRRMGLRRPAGQHRLGQPLARERRRLERIGLGLGKLLALDG